MFCRDHTVSLCGTHTVQVGGRAGSRGTPTPHWGFPVPPTHTSKIAIPQLRGDNGITMGPQGGPWGFPVPTHTPKIAIPQLRGD